MSNRYATYDEYGLRHLPRHLVRSERWEDLAGKLSDFDFIESKIEALSVFHLQEDYRLYRTRNDDGKFFLSLHL